MCTTTTEGNELAYEVFGCAIDVHPLLGSNPLVVLVVLWCKSQSRLPRIRVSERTAKMSGGTP